MKREYNLVDITHMSETEFRECYAFTKKPKSLFLIENYKGRSIWYDRGAICVTKEGERDHRFYVAIDDSKMCGHRTANESANNLKSAREYIDWLTNPTLANQ